MPLQNTETLVIPAVEEKTFPHLWLSNINIYAQSTSNGHVFIETLPYNGDTKEIGSRDNVVVISTDRLWQAVDEVPEVKAAMDAIFAAVVPLRDWIYGPKQPPVVEEPVITETPIEAPISSTETLVEETPV